MKNLEKYPEKIFELLSTTSFEQLNITEKLLVEKHMSESEYRDYHEIISDTKTLDQNILVDIPSPDFAKTQTSSISKIIHYKMPFYQVAATLAFCILSTAYLTQHFSTGQSSDITQTNTTSKTGVSLAEDNFPEQLVFNF